MRVRVGLRALMASMLAFVAMAGCLGDGGDTVDPPPEDGGSSADEGEGQVEPADTGDSDGDPDADDDPPGGDDPPPDPDDVIPPPVGLNETDEENETAGLDVAVLAVCEIWDHIIPQPAALFDGEVPSPFAVQTSADAPGMVDVRFHFFVCDEVTLHNADGTEALPPDFFRWFVPAVPIDAPEGVDAAAADADLYPLAAYVQHQELADWLTPLGFAPSVDVATFMLNYGSFQVAYHAGFEMNIGSTKLTMDLFVNPDDDAMTDAITLRYWHLDEAGAAAHFVLDLLDPPVVQTGHWAGVNVGVSPFSPVVGGTSAFIEPEIGTLTRIPAAT